MIEDSDNQKIEADEQAGERKLWSGMLPFLIIALILSIIFFLISFSAKGSTVILSYTNFLAGRVFTNDLKVYMVGNQAEFDGTWLQAGPSITMYSTNGLYTNVFRAGNFASQILPSKLWPDPPRLPIIFAVPDDTNTYNVGQLLLSGYNTYNYTPGVLRLTSSNGSVVVSPTIGLGDVDLAVVGQQGLSYVSNQSSVTGATSAALVTNGSQIGIVNQTIDTNQTYATLLSFGLSASNYAQSVSLTTSNAIIAQIALLANGFYSNYVVLTNAVQNSKSNVMLIAQGLNTDARYHVKMNAHCSTNPAYFANWTFDADANQTTSGLWSTMGPLNVLPGTNIAWIPSILTSGIFFVLQFQNQAMGSTNTIAVSTVVEPLTIQ